MSIEGQINDYLRRAVDEGRENGVQLTVFHKDKCIINACAGYVDRKHSRLVDENTLFPIFSASKGITATLLHRLAERGLFDYEDSVKKYWPGFKADVTIGQVLAMTSAMDIMPGDIIAKDLEDWDYMCGRMAEMLSHEKPGERFIYHSYTFGWLAGNIACLVTGKDFKTLLEEEIKAPLSIHDLYIGTPESEFYRIAELVDEPYDNDELFIGDEQTRGQGNCMHPLCKWMNTASGRRSCCPAVSGIATAYDLARFYASFVGYKQPLISENQLLKAVEDNRYTTEWGYRGYGYQFYYVDDDKDYKKIRFGHGGYNGSLGFADTKNKLAYGFNKNFKSDRTINGELIRVINRIIGV